MGDGALRVMLLTLLVGGCRSSEPPPAPQQAPPTARGQAEEAAPLRPTELLRRLSFDLRGRPPSVDEYELVQKAGDVPLDLLSQMLASEAFLDQVERWHAEILWPNISRYRLTAAPLAAVRPVTQNDWEDIGWAVQGKETDVGADPTLVNDAEARQRYVLAFENESTGITLRGGRHARSAHFCDMSEEAEYPDPTVVGKSANEYTVAAADSGSGEAYSAHYYSEDPDHYGMVMPIRDWKHCPNYCFETACGTHETTGDHLDENGDKNHDCYSDMTEPGDDPEGRHELDMPGMRCPSGYERIVNSCDYAVEFGESSRGRKPARGGKPGRPARYNTMRDGWRWTTHFWSRGVAIRTCAVEAQQRVHGLIRKDDEGQPIHCGAARSNRGFSIDDPSCGCGPEGVYCAPSQREHNTEDETRTEFRLREALEREPLQIVREVVGDDDDYLAILTTTRSHVNGPLALAWRHQWHALAGPGGLTVSPPSRDPKPEWEDVGYEDDHWVGYERDGRHAGILTTLEFLLRFPTARARVAQFRRKFLCSDEFDYAPKPDPSDHNPDIAKRSGCSGCHLRLETDGLYFGRYPDRSGLYLDAARFPDVNEACRYCVVGHGDRRTSQLYRCNDGAENPHVPGGVVQGDELRETCELHYANWPAFGDEEAAYAGHLWPALYRQRGRYERMTEGPRAMVEAALDAGNSLQRCTSRRVWERLVRRAPTEQELERLTTLFESEGRSYRRLVEAVVTGQPYRMVTAEEVAP